MLISIAGCAQWSRLEQTDAKAPTAGLPPIQLPSDAMPIELIFLRLGTDQLALLPSIWPNVNEQAVAADLRRRLDSNGIRAGIVDETVSLPLQKLIEGVDKRLKDDPLEQVGLAADLTSHSRMIQCRNGQRKEIAVRPSRTGSLVLLYNDGNISKGKSYDEPSMDFDLRIYPQSDGSGILTLQPEIHYGPLKQKVIGQDFALRRELKRDFDTWPELQIRQRMRPGTMLIMTSVDAPKGLGEHLFFTDTASGTKEQLVLLIRLGSGKSDSTYQSPN